MQQIYTEKYRELMESAIPSARGLYPPEILMLDYAPHYKSNEDSFQQFWGWYAVEDPLQLLHSLEERGFLENAGLETTLNKLTIPEIKELLRSYNLRRTGAKAVLIQNLLDGVARSTLEGLFPYHWYRLTDAGRQELEENEYILFMHRSRLYDPDIWGLNRLTGDAPAEYMSRLKQYYVQKAKTEFEQWHFDQSFLALHGLAQLVQQEGSLESAFDLYAKYLYLMASNVSSLSAYFSVEQWDEFVKFSDIAFSPSSALAPGIIDEMLKIKEALHWPDDEFVRRIALALDNVDLPRSLFEKGDFVELAAAVALGDTTRSEEVFERAKEKFGR